MKKEAEILLRDAELDVGSPDRDLVRQEAKHCLFGTFGVEIMDLDIVSRFDAFSSPRVNTMATTWSPFNISRKFMKFE